MKSASATALRVRPQAARTPQSIATRAKLVAIAERLFAERGIEGVSLSDINKAAGQRNKNATHYHFGSKQGLLQAILDKHIHGVSARRNQLLDEFEGQGAVGLPQVVRAFVYPVAEKLFDTDGGHHFIRFQAQLVAMLTLDVHQLHASALKIAPVERLTSALRDATPHLAPPLMRQRAMLATVLLFDGLADHSRMLEQADLPSPQIDTELFIRNLEDCIIALFSAPVSPATAERLAAASAALPGSHLK
ncbi:TetR/AcrR family transcriptional regulator [Solimonas sp. SE-A11]|uniref:TetR/AcrR family transcriptional regulator n=1 Tax=Solimonas sp. SE-A11 TaxID=3054954 RepID=UPI00259D28AB|nr:TetR/AcrR family transcriptional regulator [Solimonas sp. SE-A11]MDM4769678.1 helix-turn-helix domain-containing protein [Solimonas sp. SE-A11]